METLKEIEEALYNKYKPSFQQRTKSSSDKYEQLETDRYIVGPCDVNENVIFIEIPCKDYGKSGHDIVCFTCLIVLVQGYLSVGHDWMEGTYLISSLDAIEKIAEDLNFELINVPIDEFEEKD